MLLVLINGSACEWSCELGFKGRHTVLISTHGDKASILVLSGVSPGERRTRETPDSGAGAFRCQVVSEQAFMLLDFLACPSLLPLVCDDENQLQASFPGGRLPEQVQEQNALKVEQQSFEDIDLLS